LFSKVPPAQEAYRPYGEAEGYIDPQDEEYQYMKEKDIRAYHYHRLLPYKVIFELTGPVWRVFYLYQGWRLAQTFALTETQPITGVVFLCSRYLTGNDGTLYIRVYETTDSIPTGIALTQGERRLTTMTEQANPFTIPVAPYTLNAYHRYAIVANVVMDEITQVADKPYFHIIREDFFQPPYTFLYSSYPAGNDWKIDPPRRCLWTKILGQP